MPSITIPDSLRFYWSDRANQAAVDILCHAGSSGTPPPDLTIDELEAFEAARLAALRVRHDLWRFLRSVWSATWGVTMSAIPGCRQLTVGEHDLGSNGAYVPSVDLGWNERKTYVLYALTPVVTVFTGVTLHDGDRRDRDRKLSFNFSIMDTRTSGYPEGFDFGPGWIEDGQGWAAAEAIVERRDEVELDVEAAIEPLRLLEERLRGFLAKAHAISA